MLLTDFLQNENLPKKPYLMAGGFFVFLGIISLVGIIFSGQPKSSIEIAEAELQQSPFFDIELQAEAAIVQDLETGKILFAYNEEKKLPLASITKVMTALASDEIVGTNRTVEIGFGALKTEGDSGLAYGEKWSFDDLIDYTLVTSSNDGASALANVAGGLITKSPKTESRERAFVDYMNYQAQKIGLLNTEFNNPTGLDDDINYEANTLGSAKDIARLFNYVLRNNPEILQASSESSIWVQSQSGLAHTANNTNSLARTIPNLIASKTGYTDTAGGNLAIVFDPGLNTPVAIVVLGSTKQGRFNDVDKLVDATFKYKALSLKK